MHNLRISHHRGVCDVTYFSSLSDLLISIGKLQVNVCLHDINLPSFSPSLFNKIDSLCHKLISVPSGEESKNIYSVVSLLEQLESTNISPIGPILVIGGGSLRSLCHYYGLVKRGSLDIRTSTF